MSHRIYAISFAALTLPIAFSLLIVGALVLHNNLFGWSLALIFIGLAMGLSGVSSVMRSFKVETTPFARWMGKRYRQALLARDFKRARRWNMLCRRNASRTAYSPTIVPAAVFFLFGMVFVVPSVFVLTFY